VVAVWINATIRFEGAMLAISQVTPTSFIQVPRLETVIPSHITRNNECRMGDQREGETGDSWPMADNGLCRWYGAKGVRDTPSGKGLEAKMAAV
jgi:hypothetical protein